MSNWLFFKSFTLINIQIDWIYILNPVNIYIEVFLLQLRRIVCKDVENRNLCVILTQKNILCLYKYKFYIKSNSCALYLVCSPDIAFTILWAAKQVTLTTLKNVLWICWINFIWMLSIKIIFIFFLIWFC